MNSVVLDKILDGLNEAQAKAVSNPLQYCTKIVAGAGTGKTKIISKRFLKLVLELQEQGEENPQNKILVITFTDKAANEMKERIVKELEENGFSASTQSDLWISTFHSFCIRLLKKYSIEAGLAPSFKIADEKQLSELYANIVRRIKYNESHTIENIETLYHYLGLQSDILSIDSVSKLSKINDLESIFDDIYLVIKKIKSLGITPKEFLEKSLCATQKFSENIEKTPFKFDTKEDYANSWAEHFFAYTDGSCKSSEAIFDAIAKEKIILDKQGKRKAIEYGMAQGFPENIAPVNDVELHLVKVIAAIFAIYQAELEKRDLVDFDDLINKTIQIFKENKMICSYYQNYFKQIIVDEFQDTNGAQLELIELLLNPENVDLTFVGDRKQSIYAFRYAQMENLDVLHKNVEKRYSKKYEPINLSINYRSTPEVLNAVNFVTEQELNLDGENLCANPNLQYPDTSKDIKVTIVDGFENAYEQKIKEAEYISNEIEMLLKRDNARFRDFAVLVKSHAQADIVERELKKKNIPSVKKVNTGFFSEPVVKNVLSAFRLVKNTEDEQAFFRLLKAKFSDAEIYRMKKSFDKKLYETISVDELKRLNLCQKFLQLMIDENLDDTIIQNYALAIYETVNDIRKKKNSMTLLQVFEVIRTKLCLGYFATAFEKEQAMNNLKIIEKIIDDFSQNENLISVNSLLDYWQRISEDRNFELPMVYNDEVDAVQLLTIHASKGLEFPYVFVLSIASSSKVSDKSNIVFDMQYGDKPGFGLMVKKYNGKPNPKIAVYKNYWQKPREENEALRLFYVAVSRAKKYLNVLSFEPYSSIKPVEYIESLKEYLNG